MYAGAVAESLDCYNGKSEFYELVDDNDVEHGCQAGQLCNSNSGTVHGTHDDFM